MVYKWNENSRVKADAQKVGEELQSIPQRDAETVVAYARKDKKSELHLCFEWDDAKAGQAHRLDQARYIMRMIVTEVEYQRKGKPEVAIVRAFESVRFKSDDDDDISKKMVYVPIRTALSNDDFREQIMVGLEETIGQAERTAEKYSNIAPQFLRTKKKLQEARETVRA